jgi:hypothetical protein
MTTGAKKRKDTTMTDKKFRRDFIFVAVVLSFPQAQLVAQTEQRGGLGRKKSERILRRGLGGFPQRAA